MVQLPQERAEPVSLPRTLLLAVLPALMAIVTFAEDSRAERRMALVIGNGDYRVGPLANPVNDAELMAETLAERGFEVTKVLNANNREMQRAVVGFAREIRSAGQDTVGLIFYAGHAVQADGENYLIPVDAEVQDVLDLEIQTLKVDTVMRSLESAGNRLNMVVLDACRDNPFKSISRSASRGLAKVDAPFGTMIAYSTAPGSVATDGAGTNSPYTRALARMLKVPGLPVEQVFKQVRIAVMERTGNQQVPWESSSLTGDFYFTDPEPVVVEAPEPEPGPAAKPEPDPRLAEIEFWKSIAASDDPAIFRSYLEIYPQGVFASIAEHRIGEIENRRGQQAQQMRIAEARDFWDAVKESDDRSLLNEVAERYSDTVYAELARVKLQALEAERARPAETQIAQRGQESQPAAAPQPAATMPPQQAALPTSAEQQFSGNTVGKESNSYRDGAGLCTPGRESALSVRIDGSSVAGEIVNQSGTAYKFSGELRNGRFESRLYLPPSAAFFIAGRLDDNVLRGRIYYTEGHCADFEIASPGSS